MTAKKFPNLEKEVISQLAKDIATDKVFCSFYLPESELNLIGSIFMPILFGALKDYTQEQIKDLGFIYEYYDKAGPRGINGYPMFMSCGFVSKDDANRIQNKVDQIRKALKDI